MLPLDEISFDTVGLEFEGDQENARIWRDRFGDPVVLRFFRVPPNIEADPQSLDELRDFYRAKCVDAGTAIIEVESICVDECYAIWAIVKSPQEPSGMAYLGSITLPFRDFSYHVKLQFEEHGTTGIRDAVVLDRMLASGEVKITRDAVAAERMLASGEVRFVGAGKLEGWMQDPYDPEWVGGLARNRADDEKFDAEFPDHPLSRVRAGLRQVRDTLRVAQDVKAQPKFVFEDRSQGVPWWRRWLGAC